MLQSLPASVWQALFGFSAQEGQTDGVMARRKFSRMRRNPKRYQRHGFMLANAKKKSCFIAARI
jgi:hypothetical protein